MWLRRAIFLDRDGTLNRDFGYVHEISAWEWLPGSIAALKTLQGAGYLLIVISNQSGIARGFYSFEQLKSLEQWVSGQLQKEGIKINAWFYCPHAPDAGCYCRKPKPGMLLTAAEMFAIDLSESWMIGDKISDIEAGRNAGCKCVLLVASACASEITNLRCKYPGIKICVDLAQAVLEIVG